jgi:hypothetical protein
VWPEAPRGLALAAIPSLPAMFVLAGLLFGQVAQRQRLGLENAGRFDREKQAYERTVDPFPRDGALALRRAENLVERAGLEGRMLTQRLLRDVGLFGAFVTPAIGLSVFVSVPSGGKVATAVGALIFETLFGALFAASRQRMRTLESDMRQLDYERGLLTEDATREVRAEKLFLKQQFELKRYYDETLRQSTMLSYIGVLCIGAGFVVIALAFYLLTAPTVGGVELDLGTTQQIVIGALAAAGGLMSNFIAVLYLRMHAGTVQAMTSFHERLVGTHHVHFGALLAARVTQSESDKVLTDMAVRLAEAVGPGRGPSDTR